MNSKETIWNLRQKASTQTNLPREDFARDRARIIHSAFFRRLQGKTQVLGLGESDFYRTRLTHSLEVAQVGGGIAEALRSKYEKEDFYSLIPEQNLIESIGLAHDIGHPPFGHGGEVALNFKMHADGGFEGNAQTLRICTELGEYSEINGLNLTRRTLLGLIKYPSYYSKVVNVNKYLNVNALNIENFKPPKCIFDSSKKDVDWILDPFNAADKKNFLAVKGKDNEHSKAINKSFDCSIMELADDISYGIHDLEDAIALCLVTEAQWKKEVVDKIMDKLSKYPLASSILENTEDLFSGASRRRKKAVSKLVHYFISNVGVKKEGDFSNPLLSYQAYLTPVVKEELDMFKMFVWLNVIKLPEVQTLEYKGEQMIVRLFDAIESNPQRLLPKKYFDLYEASENSKRIICDYIAGTTDDYATKIYHKIFTPSSGSIFDKL